MSGKGRIATAPKIKIRTDRPMQRFFVKGSYVDVIYAENEEQAKEIYLEMNEKLNRTEPFDEIIVEENPFK